MTRYAARRDANEPSLVTLARQIGAVMWPLAEPVDWLCGWRGRWYPTELRTPRGRIASPSNRSCSRPQRKSGAACLGMALRGGCDAGLGCEAHRMTLLSSRAVRRLNPYSSTG